MTIEPLPPFVRIFDTAMELTPDGRYWRPYGGWGVGAKYLGGVLVSDAPEMQHLHEQPLVEITEDEFHLDNARPPQTTRVDNG
jgi:hypothetical protein